MTRIPSAGSRCFYAVWSFFIAAALTGIPISAQENPPEVEIRVTAADLSGEADSLESVDLETTTSVYATIQVSEKKGEVSSVGEVLEHEAGLQIRRTGAAGSFATVSLRGTSSNQVSVYVDGVPLNSGRSGYVDLSDIPVDTVQSIEVYKGSAPARFPGAAPGGVVNIRTRESSTETVYSVSAGLESFNTFRTSFTGFNTLEAGDLYYAGSFFSTEGNFTFLNNNGTEFNEYDDYTDTRINNDSMQASLECRLKIYSGDETVISLSETLNSREQGVPGRMNNQSEYARYYSMISLLNLSVENGDPEGEDWVTVLRTYWKHDRDEFEDLYSEVGLGAQHVRSDISESGLFALAEKRSGRHTLTVNTLFSSEVFSPAMLSGTSSHAYVPYPSSREKSALTLSLESVYGNTMLNGVLRGTHISNHISSSDYSDRSEDNVYSFQFGVKHRFNDQYSLKCNLGTYHRLPSMGELFGDWGFFLGSPELDPEYGINAEVSLDAGTSAQPLSRWIKSYSISLFRMEIRDYIAYIFNAQGIGRPDNIGKAEITGIELTGVHEVDPLTYRHSLTYVQPLDRTDIDYNYGNILPGRAQFMYSGELSWLVRTDWRLFSSVLIETGIYYDTPNYREAPDKFPVSLGVEYSGIADMKAVFRIENIFDDQYEDYGGYPLPGRMYSLACTYNF